jgi:hypothetical protein
MAMSSHGDEIAAKEPRVLRQKLNNFALAVLSVK